MSHLHNPSICQWTFRLLPCLGSCNQQKLYDSLADMGQDKELEGSGEPWCHALCFIPHSSLSVGFGLWVEQNDCIQVHAQVWASVWKHVRVWMCVYLCVCAGERPSEVRKVWLQCVCTSGLVLVRQGHIWRTGLHTVVGVVVGRCCWGHTGEVPSDWGTLALTWAPLPTPPALQLLKLQPGQKETSWPSWS